MIHNQFYRETYVTGRARTYDLRVNSAALIYQLSYSDKILLVCWSTANCRIFTQPTKPIVMGIFYMLSVRGRQIAINSVLHQSELSHPYQDEARCHNGILQVDKARLELAASCLRSRRSSN